MTEAQLIRNHESFRPIIYKCPSGKLSIGYGRNLEDNGVSLEEAEFLLFNDIKRIRLHLAVAIPNFSLYSEVRQAVFVDMAYNMGVKGLLTFKKMLQAAHVSNWVRAKEEMLDSKWAEQVKGRAIELSEMMLTGDWPQTV